MRPDWDNNVLAREWELASHNRTLKAALKHIPLSAMFELTPLCNLKCKMCYIRMSREERDRLGRELTTEEWLRLAKETLSAGTLNILLTGGEPLLRPDFRELYTELAHMGFMLSLNTNATMITPDIADLFSRYPPGGGIAVTLYGASPETYQEVCGSADGFHKTLEGLEILSSLPIDISVRSTFVRANIREYPLMRQIADRYTGSYGINPFVTKPVRGVVRDIEDIRMTAEQAFMVDDEHTDYYRNASQDAPEKGKTAPVRRSKEELIGEERMNTAREMVEVMNKIPPALLHCGAAKTQYAISWDGKMLPCLNFDTPCTLPLEIGVQSAWDRLLEESVKIPPCPECQDCEDADYCMNCPGYLQTETGSFEKAAPYLCSLAKVKKQVYQK